MRKAILLMLWAVGFSGYVHPQTPDRKPATPTDLRAAYCIEVTIQTVSGSLTKSGDGFAPGDTRKRDEVHELAKKRLARLKAYVVPRMPHVDGSAMLVEMNRGKGDAAQAAQIFDSCRQSCKNKYDCSAQCAAGKDEVKRVRSCDDLSFLPR
jgi:hypothetical protein